MRSWTKILPFFVVCWLARKYGMTQRQNGLVYAQAFGPGQKHKPEAIVLIELDPADRPEYK